MSDASGGSTKERLLVAAEQLLAERGVEGVSLREITRASGARNAVALQYHFDDRAGLLQAILDKHLPDVDAHRHALLDEIEASGGADARALAGALVRPLAAKLADEEGGPAFLQIYADLISRPSPVFATTSINSLERWRGAVGPLLAEDALRLHRRLTMILHAVAELARRARSGPHTDDRLFTSYLVDVVTSILTAPVSEETTLLAAERDRVRGKPRRRTSGPKGTLPEA
jgi:AcrR family transcriptional regulator